MLLIYWELSWMKENKRTIDSESAFCKCKVANRTDFRALFGASPGHWGRACVCKGRGRGSTCVCTCMRLYLSAFASICVFVDVCMHGFMYVCMPVCMYVPVLFLYMYAYKCVFTSVYVRMYSYIGEYVSMCARMNAWMWGVCAQRPRHVFLRPPALRLVIPRQFG